MSGIELFNAIVKSTGIETSSIKNELLSLLDKNNLTIEDLDITNLREIMAEYLLENLPINKEG